MKNVGSCFVLGALRGMESDPAQTADLKTLNISRTKEVSI